MAEDIKSRLDAVLARKKSLDEDAASKAAEEQRAEQEKAAAEATRQRDIDRDWLIQKNKLVASAAEMNGHLASERLEFKLVDQNSSEHVRAKIELFLHDKSTQKSSATITLSPDGAVKISTTKGRILGAAEIKSFQVSDFTIDYQEVMVSMLERIYPPKRA